MPKRKTPDHKSDPGAFSTILYLKESCWSFKYKVSYCCYHSLNSKGFTWRTTSITVPSRPSMIPTTLSVTELNRLRFTCDGVCNVTEFFDGTERNAFCSFQCVQKILTSRVYSNTIIRYYDIYRFTRSGYCSNIGADCRNSSLYQRGYNNRTFCSLLLKVSVCLLTPIFSASSSFKNRCIKIQLHIHFSQISEVSQS